MKNFRTLALTALSGGLIAIGSTMAFAQTANNSDNTSPGESGHGTGCSNAQTAGSGIGTGGDTNCMGSASKTMNSTDGTTTNGTMNNSTNTSNDINAGSVNSNAVNPDNSSNNETGHGTGCSNAQTSGSGNGTMNGGTGTNCQNTSN
jgi:hypothetical protein